jgi:hypothetical protein
MAALTAVRDSVVVMEVGMNNLGRMIPDSELVHVVMRSALETNCPARIEAGQLGQWGV